MTLAERLAAWRYEVKFRTQIAMTRVGQNCRQWVTRNQGTLRILIWFFASLVVAFGLLALADPYVQPPMKRCALELGWFGCVLANHESLAGACFTLVAALVAWAAIQEQLRASTADRQAARTTLLEELERNAETMGAAWGVLSRLEDDGSASEEKKARCKQAAQYACEQISRPDRIASYRFMAALLGWDDRIHFEALLSDLAEIQNIDWDDDNWSFNVRSRFGSVSHNFEWLVPNTTQYFEGLWRRSPRAMTRGDLVRRLAGDR
jgi:hypothetical protein